MLHTKFRGNKSRRFFKDFYHIWTWWPTGSFYQQHFNNFSLYLKAYMQNLDINEQVVSERKATFNFDI